jgi:inorganic pyrophosphatase
MSNNNSLFWKEIQGLVDQSEVIIDRPQGSAHPRYPDFIYPVDYGYLKDTSSSDGNEIDVWKGSGQQKINGILCTVDPVKKDIETKIIMNCTDKEIELIYKIMNQVLKAIYIPKPINEF